MRTQLREQLVEAFVGDAPRRPGHHLRPVPAAAVPVERLHRVVVGIRTPGATVPRQRERVDHRPRARLQMEVVEPAHHALTVRDRRGLVPVTTKSLARQRVDPRRRPFPTRPAEVTVRTAPMRRRFDTDLQPTAEIARLDPRRLIPLHPQRPQEPEPAQQVHPVRPLRRRRPPPSRQLREKRRYRDNYRAVTINKPIRLERISRRLETTPPRHHQPSQLPRHIPIADHEQRT